MNPVVERNLLRVLLAVAIVALVAAGALLLLRRAAAPIPGGAAAPAGDPARTAAKTLYHCPMHPGMVSDRPGDCPICGMRMVPIDEARAGGAAAPTPAARGRRVIYRSTMNPSEVSDRPGKDSMGMEMVAVEVEDAAGSGSPAVEGLAPVSIPARKQQLIGVRLGRVARVPFVRAIRAVGRVTVDEKRIHHVHTKIEGWVEMLTVNATGEKVEKGQPLLSIYSPELLATQEEYLLALRSYRRALEASLPDVARRNGELLESARRRLRLFDLTAEQINHLEETGQASRTITLYAPISGYVLERNVSHGQKIDPNTNLLDIADLSEVWVVASVYEHELPFVRVGQKATMTFSYLPGKVYRGRVGLVYPVLEGATRTAQVRLQLDNPGMELKPEMYAQVELSSDLGVRLAVPESAVLASGTRDIVFVAEGEGYFVPREVRLGVRIPDLVEVLEGLQEGETVVTSANFLIDSESRLKSALEAAAAPKGTPGERP